MTFEEILEAKFGAHPTVLDALTMLYDRQAFELASQVGNAEWAAESVVAIVTIRTILDAFGKLESFVPELKRLASRPTDFTFAEIGALARNLVEALDRD